MNPLTDWDPQLIQQAMIVGGLFLVAMLIANFGRRNWDWFTDFDRYGLTRKENSDAGTDTGRNSDSPCACSGGLVHWSSNRVHHCQAAQAVPHVEEDAFHTHPHHHS